MFVYLARRVAAAGCAVQGAVTGTQGTDIAGRWGRGVFPSVAIHVPAIRPERPGIGFYLQPITEATKGARVGAGFCSGLEPPSPALSGRSLSILPICVIKGWRSSVRSQGDRNMSGGPWGAPSSRAAGRPSPLQTPNPGIHRVALRPPTGISAP